MKKIPHFILLLSILLLSSCIQFEEIEDLGLINARGIDQGENKELHVNFVVFQFSDRIEDFASIINGQGRTISGAIINAEHHSLFPIVPGKMKVTLYGREIAQEGILSLLDTDSRDSRIPDLMYLAVSNTTAEEILMAGEENIGTDVGQYLHGLIERHTTDHNIPRKTLQDFLRIFYDIGQDNALPLIEMKNNRPNLKAVAVFQDDKLVGDVSMNDALLINLMDGKVTERLMEVAIPLEPLKKHLRNDQELQNTEEAVFAFLIMKGSSKTKILDLDTLTFETKTTINLRLLEQTADIFLDDLEAIKKIEELINVKIEAEFQTLLTKLQELNSDPFGYGRHYKKTRKGKELTREEWREMFPNIDVQFNVDTNIIRHGVID